MAKNIKRHISHLKSSGTTAPEAADLLYGEIAVGYKAGSEKLYIKNSSDQVVTFTDAASAIAVAELYADSGDVTSVTSDSALTTTLSSKNSTGRTIDIKHTTRTVQSGFKKLSTDAFGHVTGGSNVALSDLTGLGALSGVTSGTGIVVGTKSSGAQSISLATTGTAGTYKRVTVDAYGRVTSGDNTDSNSWRPVKVNNNNFLTDSSTALNLSGGTNVTLTTGSTGLLTISATDTKYTAATAAPPKVASASASGTSSNYARQDHTHGIDVETGDANGQVKIAGQNATVKGIDTAAYKAEGYFAGSGHTHTNMVTGTGLTNNAIVLGGGNSAIKTSSKTIETTLSSTSDAKIPTSKAIATYVSQQMASALTYKGSISSNDTLKDAHNVGDLWVVSSAGTYADKSCEVGDFLIANTTRASAATVTNSDWDAINGENQVENKSASLAAAGSSATIATVDGTDITITTPSTWTGVNKTGTLTGVTLASGTNNGTLKLTVNGSATDNIAVKGLGTAAYKAEGYFAGSGHTHTTTLTTDTGTSSITLTHGGKYKLGAGGTSVIFTMPSDNNTWRNVTVNGDEKLGTGTGTGALAITSGSTNGTISVAGTDVKVKGLGGAAYLNTGTTAGTVAAGDHTHSNYANQNAWSKIKINAESTTIDADTTTDTLTISGGTFVTLTSDASNDKFTIGVSTGTSSTQLARGDHSHSTYATVAFKTVKVSGATTVDVVADAKEDTITFAKDDAITLTGDATGDKVTFGLGNIECGDYA